METCPVLTPYLRLFREELGKTPVLWEAQIEKLEAYQSELEGEPPERRTWAARRYRVLLCLIFALEEERRYQMRLGDPAGPANLGTTGAAWLETVQQALANISESHSVEAGEMGLIGVRNDGQQLRYDNLQTAGDLAEGCRMLAGTAELCLRLEDPALFARAGELFHQVCVSGRISIDTRLKQLQQLMEVPPNQL